MMETIGLLIDLGNSETRVTLVRNGTEHEFEMSNRFVKLDPNYVIPVEYRNNKTFVLKYENDKYANGVIVSKEFVSKTLAPSALQAKTEQISSYISMSLVYAKAYMLLSELMNTPVENIDVEFDIRLLLPPSEHDKNSDAIKNNIMNIASVEMCSPVQFTKKINIKSIVVLPEGATAYIGSIYCAVNNEMQVVPQNEQFTEGDVLVIDIGAGTTDLVLIRDTELVVDSKETFKKGGNNVESACKKLLYKQYDYFPDDKAMKLVLSEGLLKKGNVVIEVDNQLNAAKESFSVELRNFLVDYLTRNDIEIRSVKGLLVVGGGALPAIRDNNVISPSMAEVLINYIKELTDSISLVDLNGRNPRRLNMDGLKLYYKFTS